MSIFIITFKREIPENKLDNILDILIVNLSGSLYNNIERIENNKIIIEGEFYSFNPAKKVPWNLWTSFSKRTEVSVVNKKIYYTLDYTYAVVTALLSTVVFVFVPFVFGLGFTLSFVLYCFLIYLAISIISVGYGIFRHRKLLINTLKYGSRFKGTYDWDSILKTKTIAELENIANGRSTLTAEIQELAKKELTKRK